MIRPGITVSVLAFLVAILPLQSSSAQESDIDSLTGLKMSEDWVLVRNNCIACHSPKLITQQRGDAAQWLAVIRWMQKKQNLWQFDTDTEGKIIAYLAKNYPPRADQRRVALPVDLMPPNPYAAEATRAYTDNK